MQSTRGHIESFGQVDNPPLDGWTNGFHPHGSEDPRSVIIMRDIQTMAVFCMVAVVLSVCAVTVASDGTDAASGNTVYIDQDGGCDGDEEYGDPVQNLEYAIDVAGKNGTIVIVNSPVLLPETEGDRETYKADSITFQRGEGLSGPLFVTNGGDGSSVVFKKCEIDNGGSSDPVFEMHSNSIELDDTSIVNSNGHAIVADGSSVVEVGGDVSIEGGVLIGDMPEALFLVNDDLDGETIDISVEEGANVNALVEYDDGDYEEDDFSSEDVELLELDGNIVKKADADYVYLDGVNGDDGNTGYSEDQGVASLQKAVELSQGWLDIVVLSATYVNGDYTLRDATILRGESCTGNMLIVNDTLDLYNVTVDGLGILTDRESDVTTRPDGAYLLMAYGGTGTVNIHEGTVIKGNTDTAVYGMQSGTSVNVMGGTIEGGDSYAIYAYRGSSVTVSGGTVSSDGYAICAYGSSVEVTGGSIEGSYGIWAKSFDSSGFEFPAPVTVSGGSISGTATAIVSEGSDVTVGNAEISGSVGFEIGVSDSWEYEPELRLCEGVALTGSISLDYKTDTNGPVIVMDGFEPESPIVIEFSLIPKVPFAKNAALDMFATDYIIYETTQGLMVSEEEPAEQIYLDPVEGSDDNDGLTADTPVQTLERAKSLACGMPIIVSGTISVGNDETLVVEDVTLQRAQGFDGRLILVGMYGEVTVRDATIDGMGIDTGYSLIHTQGGTINIGDGAIICNNGYTAVTVVNNGDFVMTGGEIYGNFSEDDGGAVYIRKANADISGGSIHDNQTEKSGGAIALNSGRLTVGAVEIYGNVANGTHFGFSDENTSMVGGGAAIYAESNKQTDATLAVNGAVIHHNEAKGPGGAICIVDCHRNKDIDVSLTDVEIRDNTASHGSALYIGTYDATYGYPSVSLAGSNSIEGDISIDLAAETDGPVLEVAEGYSNSERVKVIFTDALPSVIFVSYAGEPDVNDFMVDGHLVQATDGGLVIGAEFDAIYLDPAGGSDDNSGTSRDQAVKTLDKAKELAGDMPVVVCGTIEVGNSKDVVIEDVTLQRADGFTGYLIQVYVGGEVTIRNATIDGMNREAENSLVHAGQGTVNIEDGAVLRNNGYSAVTITNGGGELFMTGGEIYGNNATRDGGAIYVRHAEATITGGSIHDNTAAMSGGAIAGINAKIHIGDVEIYGNRASGTHSSSAYYGQDSYIGGGGAIYIEASSQSTDPVLDIEGASIHDNTSSGFGGAVCIYDSNDYESFAGITIGTCHIAGNTAARGAAIYAGFDDSSDERAVIAMGGSPEVSGDVYIDDCSGEDGITISVAEGFQPAAPVLISFSEVPGYAIITGAPEASDFSAGEGYALVPTDGGLWVGTVGEDGSVTIKETVADESGNVTTTTVMDSQGNMTQITTEKDDMSVTTDFSSGSAVTKVSGEDVDEGISIAVDQMSSFDGEKTVVVTGEATLSKDSIKALAGAGASLEFVSGGYSVEIGPETFSTVTEEMVFTVSESPELTEQQISAIGGAHCFDITLGTAFVGTVSVEVPYSLPSGMDPASVTVSYVAENGDVEEIPGAEYSDGNVSFETTHFSVYMIEAEPVQTPVDPDDPSIPGFPDNPDIPVIPGGGDEEGVVVPPTVVIEDGGDDGLSTTETAIVIVLGVLTAIAAVMLIVASRRS